MQWRTVSTHGTICFSPVSRGSILVYSRRRQTPCQSSPPLWDHTIAQVLSFVTLVITSKKSPGDKCKIHNRSRISLLSYAWLPSNFSSCTTCALCHCHKAFRFLLLMTYSSPLYQGGGHTYSIQEGSFYKHMLWQSPIPKRIWINQ